uniref:Uncharacterized protein n=1 Tax=Physcomitrium patens TaxID=3218 RepID=A0A2K1JDK2_PHYPA|nr:hypothetical protein PHYPA_019877 [Physcomitrium patens]
MNRGQTECLNCTSRAPTNRRLVLSFCRFCVFRKPSLNVIVIFKAPKFCKRKVTVLDKFLSKG